MMRKRIAGLALALGAAVCAVVGFTPAAQAGTPRVMHHANAVTPAEDGWQYGVASGAPPSSAPCEAITGSTVCFAADGDYLYVYDSKKDSASAVAEWYNYVDGSLYRSGDCVNDLQYGHWAVCNKNYYEGSTLDIYADVYDASEGTWVSVSTDPLVVTA